MFWKILVALFVVLLLGLELAGRVLAPDSALGISALAHTAVSAQASLAAILTALAIVAVAVCLYLSLIQPLRQIARRISRIHRVRVDGPLPCQGRSGVPGVLADAVAELAESQLRELRESTEAGQRATRRIRELEARIAEGERELKSLRDYCQTLEAVDEVTNLPNRAAFDARLDQELLRIKRNGNPLAIALFQVSRIELLNSRMGANQANLIIRNVGQTISKSVRSTDFVARYDSHTFVLMLPETPARSAAMVVEDIHRLLGTSDYTLPVGVGPLKVAAGLASTDADPSALEAIPARVAEAVSRSLENDGQRVEVA